MDINTQTKFYLKFFYSKPWRVILRVHKCVKTDEFQASLVCITSQVDITEPLLYFKKDGMMVCSVHFLPCKQPILLKAVHQLTFNKTPGNFGSN